MKPSMTHPDKKINIFVNLHKKVWSEEEINIINLCLDIIDIADAWLIKHKSNRQKTNPSTEIRLESTFYEILRVFVNVSTFQ